VHAGVATGWATMSGVGTVTATGKVTHNGSAEEQLAQLWSELERVDQDLAGLRTDMSEKESALRASIAEVQMDVQTKHGEVVRRLEEAAKKETKINATALPLIGFGILLSSGATDIARLPVCANIAVLIVFVGISVRVSWPILSDLKKASSDSSD
jgi:hypothetical protein